MKNNQKFLEKIHEKRDLISESNLQNTYAVCVIRRSSSKFKVLRYDPKPDNLNEINRKLRKIVFHISFEKGSYFYDDNSII